MKNLLAAFIVIVFHSAGFAAEPQVDQFLIDHQPSGWGPPYIIDQKSGNLHGSVDTLVVLYSYQIGEERDRNHWQYLVAFEHFRGEFRPSRWLLVGGGRQRFQKLEIENQRIILSGVKHLEGDAMCCPTGNTVINYIFRNGGLIALGN